MKKLYTLNTYFAAIILSLMLVATARQAQGQTANSYGFTAVAGTYTQLSPGGTATSLTATADEAISTSFPIGFTFNYCGTNYTTVRATSNGVLTFNAAGTNTLTNNLATATVSQRTAVAPLWDDLQCTAGARYTTTGLAPNRVLTVEWLNMEWNWLAAAAGISFQVILYETTNVIEFVYRQQAGALNGASASIGIMGTATTDYISLQNTSASPTISTIASNNTLATKPANGQIYRFTPPPPCTGTPTTPVIAGPANACPSQAFTLTATNVTTGLGMQYQWQSDPGCTNTWGNIAGATSPTSASVTQTTQTCYRLVTTCTNTPASATSNEITVTMNPFLNCYPANFASSTADTEMGLAQVDGVTSLSQSSTCATLAPGPGSIQNRYSNYTGVTPVQLGQNTVSSFVANVITCGGNFGNGVQVFIDYNQDGDFLDAGERVYSSAAATTGPHSESGTFTVPGTATLGITGMRFVVAEAAFPTATNYAHTAYTWGETEDYRADIVFVPNCTGAPSAGTATVTPNTLLCPSTNFTLSATSISNAPGITYQWQANNATLGAWTNLPAGGITLVSGSFTSPTAVATGQTEPTQYQMVTSCSFSAQSNQTNIVSTTQDVPTNCYCTPTFSSGNGFGDFLNSVSLSNISNLNTGANAPGPSYYILYPAAGTTTTQLDRGSSYTLTVQVGTYTSNDVAAWIDFNLDGDFIDAGEKLGEVLGVGSSGTTTINFTVPAVGPNGATRLRVRDIDGASGFGPCTTYTFGETEDYVVTLVTLPPCTGAPVGGTTTSSDPAPCTGLPITLSTTGSTTGAGLITYQWQIANICGGPWSDIATATAPNYNYTFTAAQTRTFRRRMICTATNDTAYSTCLSLTSTLCYCAPSHTTGTGSGVYIDSVRIDNGGINHGSGASGSAPFYSDFTGSVAPGNMMAGAPYWVIITNGSSNAQKTVRVWFDWNQDGDFADANEPVNTGFVSNSPFQKTYHFLTVPATALPGSTRMRVRISNVNAVLDPCLGTAPNYVQGESEDYAITVVPNACVSPTQAGFVTGINPTFTVVNDYIDVNVAGGIGTLTGYEIDWDLSNGLFTPPNNTIANYTGEFIANVNPGVPTGFVYIRARYQNGGCPVAFSNDAFVKLNCASSCTNNTNDNDDIARVMLGPGGSILDNNQGVWPNTHDATLDGYQNYTTLGPFPVNRATPIPFQVGVSTSFTQGVRVWIDYDGDGILTAAESVYSDVPATGLHPAGTITIPCGNSYSGPAVMRVMNTFAATPNVDPCFGPITGARGWGEIEEYTLFINPNPSLTATPSNAVCLGVSNNIVVSGGVGNYTWVPAATIYNDAPVNSNVNITTGGTPIFYTVTGTLANGCSSNAIIPVASTPLGGTVTPVSKAVCSGGSQVFTATGIAGDIQWQTASSPLGPWTNVGVFPGATTFNLTGVIATTYVRALAKTNLCWDVASTTGVAYISATPTITFTNVTATSATVSWTPAGATDYTISWVGAGSGSQTSPANPFTITGLTSNTNLSVTITKTSVPACAGVSAATATTTTLCAKPTVSSVTAVVSPTGVKGLKVIWTAVAGATAYRVYYRPLVMNANWSSVDTAGGTTKTIMPLYAGVPYAVMVAANNCPGAGQLGQPSDVNYFTYTAPGLPACGPVPTITAVSNCPNQLTANLSGGTGTWRVTARRLSPSFSAGVSYTVSSPVVNLSITATPTGSVWEVFAQAVCGSSYSGLSNVEVVTVKAPCLAPQNVVVSHPDCDGFTVAWNPAVCGGLTLSNYQVYIKKSTAVNYVSYNGGSGDHKTFPYPALAPGTYTVFVRAITCNGSMSAASTVETGVVGGPGCKTGDEETTEATEAVVAASIYPNPTAGQFSVEVTATSKNEALRIEVADALGRVVYTDLSDTEAGLPSLRVLNLPESMSAGLYTVRIAAGQNTWTERLVLQRD